jgi:hypothetical protein
MVKLQLKEQIDDTHQNDIQSYFDANFVAVVTKNPIDGLEI